jgi:hypothetical protein
MFESDQDFREATIEPLKSIAGWPQALASGGAAGLGKPVRFKIFFSLRFDTNRKANGASRSSRSVADQGRESK